NPLPSAPWMGRGFDNGMGMRGPGGFGGFAGPGVRGPGPGGPRGDRGLSADSVSREISNTTNLIKLVRDDLAYANGKMDTTNLTDAQNAYKDAYSAYQAGKYADAVSKARLADELSGVADQIVHAASAPNSTDTPVTVPAPNF